MSQPVVSSCRLSERPPCAYFAPMKTLALELPDPLAAALNDAVVDGGFRDAGEVAREALRDYLSHRRFALQERHQLDDIAAALAEVKPLPPPR
jgi:Arc/MetJ-type ribon-helix-helix transcriptional regulator